MRKNHITSAQASIHISRLLILSVTGWNLQAAFAFMVWPGSFAPSFELSGAPGLAAVQGTGLLFLMWNIPYLFALWHPRRNRVSLLQALLMQGAGVLGETLIYSGSASGHIVLQSSIQRFIVFDAVGLVLLLAAWALVLLLPPSG